MLHTLTQTKRGAPLSALAQAFKGVARVGPLSQNEAECTVRSVVWRLAVLTQLTQMCGLRFSQACAFKV